MKIRPLTLVGTLFFTLAIFVAWSIKEESQTSIKQPQSSVSLPEQQRMLKPRQEKPKAKVSGVYIITTKAAMNISQPAQ